VVLLFWLGSAHAERPITYSEVLVAAAATNGGAVTARHQVEGAQADVVRARGVFDPLYLLDASTVRSRSKGFLQGFPFDSTRRSWSVTNSLTGAAGTGTSYRVDLGLDHDVSEFTTNFGAGPQTSLQDAYTGSLSGSVTQQLLRGIRFRYNTQNVDVARAQLTAAELAAEQARQTALLDAATAYWSWVYAVQVRDNATDNVVVAEEALRVGRVQLDLGKLAPFEVTRLEAGLVQARSFALDAEVQEQAASNTLLLLMGESPDQLVVPATAAGDVPPVELDAERATAVAREDNLELRVARTTLEQRRMVAANAKHGALPSLAATLGGGVASQRCPPGTDNQGCTVGNALDAITGITASDNQPFVTLGGTFSVPLGNHGARGLRDGAAADVAIQERAVADLERQVASSVENVVRTLSSARQRTELADANLTLAEQTLKAEESLALVGRSIQKTVLEARNAVLVARADAAKARTDYRLAQAQLLALQGQLTTDVP
jgi:outer membrane protein TolC